MEIIDTAQQSTKMEFGGFWVRFGASLLDALILAPLTFGLAWLNITQWKSIPVLLVINVIGIAYKPVMEASARAATLGKMAFNLKVVNIAMQRATIKEVLLRNVFHLAGAVASLFFNLIAFSHPDFEEITGYMQYGEFLSDVTYFEIANYSILGIVIIDAIMLLVDSKKRALHDRIANTYVLEIKQQ